jgi:hypothetical protein
MFECKPLLRALVATLLAAAPLAWAGALRAAIEPPRQHDRAIPPGGGAASSDASLPSI